MAKKKSSSRTVAVVVAEGKVRHAGSVKRRLSIKTRLCLVLFALCCLLYGNTLQNSFAMDDGLVIVENSLVNQGIKAIPALLASPHLKGYKSLSVDTYRPLSLVMFAIEHEIFGVNPGAGHFFNVLVFAGCVLMLFLFFDSLFEQKKTAVAFIAALIFALHPIHTEVVANIKSRDELLCFFFAFCSLNLFIDYAANGRVIKLVSGVLTLFLSLLSKETSITFIVIIPLIFFFYRNENRSRSFHIVICTIVVAGVFFLIRSAVLRGFNLAGDSSNIAFLDNQLVNVPQDSSRLATAILAMGYYIKLLFIPYPLLCNYSYSTIPFVSFGNGWALLSFSLYLSLIVFALYRIVKYRKDPWAVAALFFLVSISLFTNIPFLVGELFAERFAFFASVGFCLFGALIIEKWVIDKSTDAADKGSSGLQQPKVLVALTILLLIFGGMTYARNKDWTNDYILYKTDAENAPENSRLPCYAANVLATNLNNDALRPELKSQMTEQAIAFMQKSIALYSGNAEAHAGLGQLYLRKKMFDSAEAHERKAVELEPKNTHAINNLAGYYFTTRQFSQALRLYEYNLVIDPEHVSEYTNIGLCFYYMQVYDSALIYFKKSLSYFPEDKNLPVQIANTYKAMGQNDSAIK